jgi:hypothetical protein
MNTVVLRLAGWLCILVGAAGLVLPFMPGTVLLGIGLTLLSKHYAWARRLLARIHCSLDHDKATARRFWMRLKKRLHCMRLYGLLKYFVIVLMIAIEIIEEQGLHRVLITCGIHPADSVWDDIVLGATLGIVP